MSIATTVVRVLVLAIGWVLAEAIVIVASLTLLLSAWRRGILIGQWAPLALALALTVLAGVFMALISLRLLVGPIREMHSLFRAVCLVAGGVLAVISFYALAQGLAATEWSFSSDSCIWRSDSPQGNSGYRVSRSSSPPWGMVCTYRLEGGRTVTLPQWYPERALPHVGLAAGLGLLYAAGLGTFRRRTAPV
jgi:hypothetical protein